MGQKLGKLGRKRFTIKEVDEPKTTPIDLEKRKSESPEEGVSVSLKYYRPETECFSDWQSGELKKFSGMLKKIKQLSVRALQGNKSLCDRHKNAPAAARFARPTQLSEDLSLFELKVDPGNAARVHGVFVGSVFFLIWLDRHHAVYPE